MESEYEILKQGKVEKLNMMLEWATYSVLVERVKLEWEAGSHLFRFTWSNLIISQTNCLKWLNHEKVSYWLLSPKKMLNELSYSTFLPRSNFKHPMFGVLIAISAPRRIYLPGIIKLTFGSRWPCCGANEGCLVQPPAGGRVGTRQPLTSQVGSTVMSIPPVILTTQALTLKSQISM